MLITLAGLLAPCGPTAAMARRRRPSHHPVMADPKGSFASTVHTSTIYVGRLIATTRVGADLTEQ